ncbi:transposase [Cohnella luojiensis]|uniref:Transposase n=1 Tax=Cohnella luojiensis TaxID=652876 RepID=A0A4Y8M9E0_9BACL|nr:transposase [Cohnella luojiensis]TFE31745.1 transposase [Cohnella luojiensis]
MDDFLDFEHFCKKYDKEEACIDALFFARWPEGYCCPRCAHRRCYVIRSRRLPLYECSQCRAQTSLISGTIFEGTRTSLIHWFQAIFLHAAPEGTSAIRLASIIGSTYKTAWLICHKIRHAMSSSQSEELLSGLVRVNWGVYGRPHNPTIYRHPQEQPLLAGASIDKNDQITHLKIMQVAEEHLIYDRITPAGGREFVSRHVNSSTADISVVIQKFSRQRYFPIIQRCYQASQWINHIFNGIGPKHLQAYLDQFCFGFNMTKRDENIFGVLFHHCASTTTLKYPTLINRKNNSAMLKNDYFELLRKAG